MMNRRTFSLTAAGAGIAMAAAPAISGQTKGGNMYRELFEASLKDKKGVMIYVNGQSIPGVVTRMIGDEAVEVRNQQISRAIIRIDRIDAVALS